MGGEVGHVFQDKLRGAIAFLGIYVRKGGIMNIVQNKGWTLILVHVTQHDIAHP